MRPPFAVAIIVSGVLALAGVWLFFDTETARKHKLDPEARQQQHQQHQQRQQQRRQQQQQQEAQQQELQQQEPKQQEPKQQEPQQQQRSQPVEAKLDLPTIVVPKVPRE